VLPLTVWPLAGELIVISEPVLEGVGVAAGVDVLTGDGVDAGGGVDTAEEVGLGVGAPTGLLTVTVTYAVPRGTVPPF
jgi:hypothetical protein